MAVNLEPDFLAKTALESPALPTIISVGVIIAEQAVHPAANAISSVAPLPKSPPSPPYFL
jgi:hypothetical protein